MRERESGFTLVEILVAVAILVIVVGAVYGAFRAGSQSTTMVEEDADLHQTARVILGRMNSQLSSLHKISGTTESCLTGKSAADTSNPDGLDTLTFTTVSHKPMGSVSQCGDVCTVSYYAKCNSDGSPRGLFGTEDYTLGLKVNDDQIQAQETKISALVIGMKCQYLDPDSSKWVDDWVGKTLPPTAVHIELIMQTKRRNSHPISVYSTIYLPSWSRSTTTTTTSSSAELVASEPLDA